MIGVLQLRGATRGLGVALVAASLAALAACAGRRVESLVSDGDYAAAIAVADGARRPVRGAAARALAEARVATGQFEAARAGLQYDYRRGGDLESLVALARLELDAGLLGVAAAHFARAIELDAGVVAGDARVCALLVARARAQLRAGAATAANFDLRRAAAICDRAALDARLGEDDLEARVAAAAEHEARARRALQACGPGGGRSCRPGRRDADRRLPLEAEVAAALALARAEGPRGLEGAARRGLALEAADVATLLAAELGGELGAGVVDDAAFLGWISDLPTAQLAAAADARGPQVGAYARLRLAAARPADAAPGGADPPEGAEDEETVRRWLLTATGGEGGFRALLIAGRLDEAELALAARLRARRPAAPPAGSPVPAHWTEAVPVDAESLRELLALGELLEARGRHTAGLELVDRGLYRAVEAGIAGAEALWADAFEAALAAGAPWRAWVLAERAPPARRELAQRAAMAQLAMLDAACGGGCGLEAGAEVAARVRGEPWVEARRRRAVEPGAWTDAPAAESCGIGASSLRADAGVGPHLRASILGGARPGGQGRGLAAAFESDLTLGCEGRVAGRLLAAAGHEVIARELAERYAHLPNVRSPATLEAFAVVALAAGQPRRAELWIEQAAALSVDPMTMWARAASDGRALGAREYELHALRQLLLHAEAATVAPGSAWPGDLAVRRALLASRLVDHLRPPAHAASLHPPELAAVLAAVNEHFVRIPAALRWREGRELLEGLRARGLRGPEIIEPLQALLALHVSPTSHREAWARLAEPGGRGGSDGADRGELAADMGELWVRPPALAQRELPELLRRLDPDRRLATVELLLRGPVTWRGGRGGPLLPDQAAVLEVALRP